MEDPDVEESFTYPDTSESRLSPPPSEDVADVGGTFVNTVVAEVPGTGVPSPAQLEAIYAAASSGDLGQLQRLFGIAWEESSVNAFALANDATSRTGLTPLHAASSRGHLDVAQWRECEEDTFYIGFDRGSFRCVQ